MLPAILICAFMVKNAATQTVTASLGTTKSCVLIGDDVKLLCTASTGCCSSARVWEKVGAVASLLNDGLSPDSSKYVEDYDAGAGTIGGSIAFNLIIKNVQTSDFGVKYKCRYGLTSSNELYLDNILCTTTSSSSELNISALFNETTALFNETTGDCRKCAGKDYGWAFIGTVIVTVIGTVIMIIAKVKKVCLRVGELKTVLIVGGLTFIISAGVDYVALPICEKLWHCNDERCWWLFLLGLVISLIIGVITLICMQKQGCCKDLRPLLDDESLFSKCTGCYEDLIPLCGDESTVPTVKVQRSSYVVTTGETMTLVCTVTSRLTISSVQWERNVGGSTTTIDSNTNINKYSGSTATTPSLTILKAASSDEGTYRCFASNSVGTGQSTTIIVDVSTEENDI